MQIEIKKDIEKEYKDELIKGFSLKEAAALAISLVIAVAFIYLMWRYLGFEIKLAIYVAVPCVLPILAMGFLSIQGLSPWQYFKEMLYTQRTKNLAYDADELPICEHIFTMQRLEKKKKIQKPKNRMQKIRRR